MRTPNGSGETVVAWRDDGYWKLTWLRISLRWTSGHVGGWPPGGFVGRASTLFLATGPHRFKLKSTLLRPLPGTPGAPLWRLICAWATSPLQPPTTRSGTGSARNGKNRVADGAAAFESKT